MKMHRSVTKLTIIFIVVSRHDGHLVFEHENRFT